MPSLLSSEELDLFIGRLESPRLTWNESYDLKGMRSGFEVEQYWFYAICKLCNSSSEDCDTAFDAKIEHFKHCSRQHSYVFPENSPVQGAKTTLQEIIIGSMLYDLPLPGYEDHKNCVKQFKGDRIVCIEHY